ncbi:U-box domain-containing protein 27-like [Phalaenopsis equestris]|uniref:U-box domain-containing protein 27-like n=1 Tax=Phalaenopsis equestris TaxID=78828 RepID=UPI0009E5407B|nr:U-box domain-containing protein 27-like [Phalaenopsis equestris]
MKNRNQPDNRNKQEIESTPLLHLDVSRTEPLPSFFRCPISLEVMRSPVSLCTGVTYDRSSIQRWLDSGNTTCPATMQPLSSTDLIPNLNLHRLINLWYSSNSSDQNLTSLSNLVNTLSDPTADEAYKLSLISSGALRSSALVSLFLAPQTVELAVTLTSRFLSLDLVKAESKRALIKDILSVLDAATSGIVTIFKGADDSPPRVAAAKVLEMLIAEERTVIAEKTEVMTELLRLLGENDAELVDAGLRCLMGLIGEGRRVRVAIVRMGAVPALIKVMERQGDGIPTSAVARAMRVMESVTWCGEGKAAICIEAERCVVVVLGVLMKVGNEGKEAAVAVLWSVCCAGGGDRRAREAAAAAKGGLAKILLVMQGACSPSVRKMAGDLLRVFRGNAKCSMGGVGYDSETIHIMPF